MKVDPKRKEVLTMLGLGVFLSVSIIFPGLPLITKKILDIAQEEEIRKKQKDWDKFNLWRLRQLIKRMQDSKYIEIKEENGIPIIKITQKGKNKLLSYDLEKLKLNETKWDGRWRLIIYDVQKSKRANSETFRRALLRLNLLKLQKSVYLTPFKCEDEIEYLRLLFDIGKEVQILTVGSLENESAYRRYFGI
ncbi:hypothetical protein HYU92_03235 [Candidatus Curtissbacteria bacterium]|nr:hypothetical protein [Candidatus Curtissbacteria bacterium]